MVTYYPNFFHAKTKFIVMDRSLHFNEKVSNGKEMNGSVYFLYKKENPDSVWLCTTNLASRRLLRQIICCLISAINSSASLDLVVGGSYG